LKYQKSINFYKSTALTNSQTIITQALKSYNANEINYIEYLNVVSNALDIESNYLNMIFQNDLAVLKSNIFCLNKKFQNEKWNN
jgi:heavy metal efflux system protein